MPLEESEKAKARRNPIRERHRARILTLLRTGRSFTRSDVVCETTISDNTVHSIMIELENDGLVEIKKIRVRGRVSKFAWLYTQPAG